MNDQQHKSGRRVLKWIALICCCVLLLTIAGGLLFLFSHPLPSEETITAADQRYQRTRALFPNFTPGPSQPTPTSHSTSTTESLQARCDRLFLSVLIPCDPACGDVADLTLIESKLPQARELADLYDTGIRVSPEARRHYALFRHNFTIRYLAETLLRGNGLQPDYNVRATKIVRALKFLKMIDSPNVNVNIELWLNDFLYSGGPSLLPPDLPPALKTLDTELISPRKPKPIDWDSYFPMILDQMHGMRKYQEKFLSPVFVFNYMRGLLHHSDPPERWYEKPIIYLISTKAAITHPRLQTPETLEDMLENESRVQHLAESWRAGKITPEKLTAALGASNINISERLCAAAIELRQGAPLPAPAQITPDSYLYDLSLKKPFLLSVYELSTDVVCVLIQRAAAGNPPMILKSINLPRKHPGLDNFRILPQSSLPPEYTKAVSDEMMEE
ncbi:hypothetical protein LLG95_13855 [bacterium]|nr:hypothetical protein [bacterium]